ncbi:hypothetical protein J2Y40_002725 [Chryseobacterium sp. 2987]|nr:hypothetical protein [Chryseobacterium sp. 2987]
MILLFKIPVFFELKNSYRLENIYTLFRNPLFEI